MDLYNYKTIKYYSGVSNFGLVRFTDKGKEYRGQSGLYK